jgi:catechol 2,3-dioxygenase-like lactoylglutathione lyase family enzyme
MEYPVDTQNTLGGILMFTRIDHVAYAVSDLEKTASFYEKYFGFKKVNEEDIPIPFFQEAIYLKLNGIILELFRFKSELPEAFFHFCLYSDDFDRDFNRLKSEGVPVDMEPQPVIMKESVGKNLKRAIFVGPDGEFIEMRG